MRTDVLQALLVAVAGLCFAVLVLALARRGLLTLRYTLAWLTVALCGVALVFVTPVLKPIAASVGISPTGVLLSIASTVLLLITLQITVTASALSDALQTLTEAHALLDERVARIEQADMGPAAR